MPPQDNLTGVDPDSGPYHGGCNLFHWDESGPQDEAEKELWDNTDDPWKRCKDYKAI